MLGGRTRGRRVVLPAGEGLEECFFLARIATVFLLAF